MAENNHDRCRGRTALPSLASLGCVLTALTAMAMSILLYFDWQWKFYHRHRVTDDTHELLVNRLSLYRGKSEAIPVWGRRIGNWTPLATVIVACITFSVTFAYVVGRSVHKKRGEEST